MRLFWGLVKGLVGVPPPALDLEDVFLTLACGQVCSYGFVLAVENRYNEVIQVPHMP